MEKNRKISDIFPIGQNVFFHSGNYIGAYAKVEKVENESKSPLAIFGFLITVRFDNGTIGLVEKTEHMTKL